MAGVIRAMPEIELDIGSCCGFGNCVLVCPDVFSVDADTNRVKLIGKATDTDTLAKVHRAAAECPTHVITTIANDG